MGDNRVLVSHYPPLFPYPLDFEMALGIINPKQHGENGPNASQAMIVRLLTGSKYLLNCLVSPF